MKTGLIAGGAEYNTARCIGEDGSWYLQVISRRDAWQRMLRMGWSTIDRIPRRLGVSRVGGGTIGTLCKAWVEVH